VCDGDILQSDVELGCALGQVVTDALGDGFTLGNQLGRVELGYYCFQDFIADRREDTLIVVLSEVLLPAR
jgi:hypothetical protein